MAIWDLDLTTEKEKHLLVWSGDPVCVISFSDDGKWLVSGHESGAVKLWDVAAGTLKRTFEGHKSSVHALAISLQKKIIVSGGLDSTIRVWDLDGIRQARVIIQDDDIFALGISSNGAILASGNRGGTVYLYDLMSGRKHLSFAAHKGYVISVIFNQNGKTMFTGSTDGKIKIWALDY